MPPKLRIALLSAIPIAALLLPLFIFAISRGINAGEVPRGVVAAGIDLSGLGREDAEAALLDYEESLAARQLEYVVDGERFVVEPRDVGFGIDETSIVDTALAQREDGFFAGFFDWMTGFNDSVILQVEATLDTAALAVQLDEWERNVIAEPTFEGSISIIEGVAVAEYPRAGQGIDRTGANRTTLDMIQTAARRPIELTTLRIEPQLEQADLDEAVADINLLIGSPVTLTTTDPDFEFTIAPAELAAAYDVNVETNSPTTIEMGFDEDAIAALLEQYRGELELPARDARFELVEINDAKLVELKPGRPETLLDVGVALEAIEEAARSSSGSAELPLAEGTPPRFTTEAAEAMLPITKVSSWTTNYTPGQQRVKNIQLFADTIDGALVWPGDSFSLNSYVGERTTAKGYVPAPMILAGELADSVGGGVSQFATTFYNAVFYGCYEDVYHKPHSYYFTRYPEVNEATISWTEPDLEFRNNSDAVILIDTSHTRSSVTVSFYGNNGGCEVERVLGNRFNFTQPKETLEGDPTVDPGSPVVEQKGAGGWSNTVKRIMRWPDGTEIEEEFFWRYRAQPRLVRVHPCELEDAEEECPLPVPGVIGQAEGPAVGALQGAGFLVTVQVVTVATPDQDGLVQAQSVAAGEFLPAGSTLTIQVGEFIPPEPPPDPPPDP